VINSAPVFFPLFSRSIIHESFSEVWPPIRFGGRFWRDEPRILARTTRQHNNSNKEHNNTNSAIPVAWQDFFALKGMLSSPNVIVALSSVSFIRYNPENISRKGRTSTVEARLERRNKLTPTNVLTCLQVRNFQTATGSSNPIIICCNCGGFDAAQTFEG
jgi:hypothetical protein